MRWLADECVAAPLVEALRRNGHDVSYVVERAAGASDDDVIAMAMREERLLLTEDKDFGDLVFRRSKPVPGIVLLRVSLDISQSERLMAAIERCGEGYLATTSLSRMRDSGPGHCGATCSGRAEMK